jgi:archaellum component FlaF (FlaF/FlaG flagellin family)
MDLDVSIHSIYTFIDNSKKSSVEEKRKYLKNKYIAEHHHFYVANYSVNDEKKEMIIVIHKENEDSIDKHEILDIISQKENIQINEIKLKKFW